MLLSPALLRVAFISASGALLTLASYFSPFSPAYWTAWCLWTFLCGFIVPIGIITGLSGSLEKSGLSPGDWRWSLSITSLLWVAMIPFLLWARGQNPFRDYYRPYVSLASLSPSGFLIGLFLYMWGWEFLFRGFLLFGLLPYSRTLAVLYPTLLFTLAHWGKPIPELIGSFFAGLILAVVSMTCRSFLPAFLTHFLVYVTFIAFVA